jgi:hypothetical protein
MFQFIKNFRSREVDGEISVEDLVEFIKNPDFQRKLEIGRARTAGKGSSEYDRIKSSLMCFIPTYTHDSFVNAKSIIEPTGYLYLDFDYQSKFNFSQYPFIVAAWSSLSNEGLGVLVKVNNLHQESLLKATEYIAFMFGLECDRRAVSRDRNCVISFDPEIYYNPQHTEVSLPEFEVQSLEVNSSVKEERHLATNILTNIKNSTQVSPVTRKIRFTDFHDLVKLLDFQGKDYIDFGEEGFKYTELGIYSIIKEGSRFIRLLNHCQTLKALNRNISKNYIKTVAIEVNKRYCVPRLDDKEIARVVNLAHKFTGEPFKNKSIRFVFNPEINLPEAKKASIRAKSSGLSKRKASLTKIITTLENWNFSLLGEITFAKLAKESEVSLKTVSRRSLELRELVDIKNLKNVKK